MLKKLSEYVSATINMLKPVMCVICGQYITGRYYVDSWKQPAHEHHDIKYCFCCGRITGKNALSLPDERQICIHCQPKIVKTKQEIDWVEKKVREVFAKVGFNDVPLNLPIEICNVNKLNSLYGSNNIDLNQRGLAHFTKIITNGITKLEHKIYIIDYMTKTAFAGVLAHELLHVWQNEKGINAPRNICEGFCNLGSYIVFYAINNQDSNKFIEQMEMNPDSIYGEGYRKVKKFLDKNGWPATIAKIKNYKK